MNCERGASAVEFGLILPLLVALLMGVMEFGRAFHTQITLTHAAREAVRVHALGTADPVERGESAAATVTPVVVNIGDCEPGEPTWVTVSHDFEFIVPMFGSELTLTGIGEMRCGG